MQLVDMQLLQPTCLPALTAVHTHSSLLACLAAACLTSGNNVQANRKLLQGQSFQFPDFPSFPQFGQGQGQEKGQNQGEQL